MVPFPGSCGAAIATYSLIDPKTWIQFENYRATEPGLPATGSKLVRRRSSLKSLLIEMQLCNPVRSEFPPNIPVKVRCFSNYEQGNLMTHNYLNHNYSPHLPTPSPIPLFLP